MGIDLITLKRFRTFGFAAFIQNLRDGWMLQYALQRQQWFLYLPIFLSFGIGAYYMLPLEPPLALGAFALILSLSALFAARGRGFALACMLCIICLGFFAAQMRTSLVHTPILQSAVGPTNVQGRIVSIEDLGDEAGSRLVLSELSIEGVSTEDTPRKIRLKSRKDEGLFVGQRISTLAKIHSPSPPVMPGGFDFQRYLYLCSRSKFQQVHRYVNHK